MSAMILPDPATKYKRRGDVIRRCRPRGGWCSVINEEKCLRAPPCNVKSGKVLKLANNRVRGHGLIRSHQAGMLIGALSQSAFPRTISTRWSASVGAIARTIASIMDSPKKILTKRLRG
ncbi:MAG: hypothetical protein CM15mP74_17070 [Halieaceae bacterium]|nr:MAG: hypothetical protein CM15mP74_17070 [Halieaceae bacterium]